MSLLENGDFFLTIEIEKETHKKIRALGKGGIYTPISRRFAYGKCFIIDLDFLRNIPADIDYDTLKSLIITDKKVHVSEGEIEQVKYLYVIIISE